MKFSELLKKKPTERAKGSKATRLRIACLERDNYQCVKCGNMGLESDHIIAIALGGKESLKNRQTLCSKCHREKTNKDIEKIAKVKKERKFRDRWKL